ncbi:hypothetical protein LJ658_05260 [Mucilaginibacter sp. UR6-11]|nr:hypothetical protein [Mucilaginibacter sp. UR6-11]
MKHFFRTIIILFVLISGISKSKAAIAINSFSIATNNLNNGKVAIGTSGSTNVTFSFSLTRGFDSNGQYETTIAYVRLVYKSPSGVFTDLTAPNLSSSDISVGDFEFAGSYLYSKTTTASIPAADIGGTVYLDVFYWDKNNLLMDLTSSTTYTTVSIGSTGTVTTPPIDWPTLDVFFLQGSTLQCNIVEGDPYITTSTTSRYGSTKISVSDTQPVLLVGQSIYSPNHLYRLTLQVDGNLVLYKKNTDGSETGLWSSRTVGKSPTGLYFQSDGNLVLYTGDHTPTNPVSGAWASMLYNNTGMHTVQYAFYLLQNDGNFVEYWPTYDVHYGLVWAVVAATDTGNNGVGAVTAHGGSLNPWLTTALKDVVSNFKNTPWQ